MGFFTVAAVNSDLVIGIVAVIGWIIAQALSAKKNQAPPPLPPKAPSAGPGDRVSPNDEMRKFFQDLERGLTGQTEPKEEPVPVRRASSPSRPHHHAGRPPPIASRQEALARLPPEPVVAYTQTPELKSALVIDETARRTDKPAHKWAMGYTQRGELQRMIVAREVLGPPLALRKPDATAHP